MDKFNNHRDYIHEGNMQEVKSYLMELRQRELALKEALEEHQIMFLKMKQVQYEMHKAKDSLSKMDFIRYLAEFNNKMENISSKMIIAESKVLKARRELNLAKEKELQINKILHKIGDN